MPECMSFIICIPVSMAVKLTPGSKPPPATLEQKWELNNDVGDLSLSADGEGPFSPPTKVSKNTSRGTEKTRKKDGKWRSRVIKPVKDSSSSDKNTAPVIVKAKGL